MSTTSYPVHNRISVTEGETIYKTDEWWKAAVRHSIEGRDKGVAIYLWNRQNGSWTRKNKYRVSTIEAWESDKSLISEHLDGNPIEVDKQSFPVSDYYSVAHGETVFKTDSWWKAVLTVSQKGDYETHEVFVYVWQLVDEDWRRRQKFAIKDKEAWDETKAAVNDLWGQEVTTRSGFSTEDPADNKDHAGEKSTRPVSRARTSEESEILERLQQELQAVHLGE